MRLLPLPLTFAVACSYGAGSFADGRGEFAGPRAVLKCIDVAVALVHRPEATGPVLEYGFGNRCDRAVTVDLATVSVVAREASGGQLRLRPYDPGREIRALPIDGHWSGRERIEYRSSSRAVATSICVDVSTIDTSGAGTTTDANWLCVDEADTKVQL